MKLIETDKTKHDSLIDSMRMFENAKFLPYVGIFWYDTDKNELFGVYKTMVSDLEFDRNGRKTYPILHKDIWNKEANKARYRNKPTKFKGDYTLIPRGRIFQYEDGHFEVMVGTWINSYDIKADVMDEFDLPENNTEFIIDEHWDIGHGWSDELFQGENNIMKVFLGGTCSGYDWRSELTPKLNCDYYNPIVKDWNAEAQLRELQERKTSDFVLYTITNDMKGIYSIAEVVDDSNKRPRKTIFCNLYKNNGSEESKQMEYSLFALEQLLRRNNVRIFHALDEVANYLNLFSRKYE